MGLDRLKFGVLYRIGITPWEGHALPDRFREIADHGAGRALDLGCGTGDISILLARGGWEVTAVDLTDVAIGRARRKADAAGAKIRFLRGDVTRLRELGVGEGYDLVVDMGCFHGLSDELRDAYSPEVAAVAGKKSTHFAVAFVPGSRPPRGITREEMLRRFGPEWKLVADGESYQDNVKRAVRWYEQVRIER